MVMMIAIVMTRMKRTTAIRMVLMLTITIMILMQLVIVRICDTDDKSCHSAGRSTCSWPLRSWASSSQGSQKGRWGGGGCLHGRLTSILRVLVVSLTNSETGFSFGASTRKAFYRIAFWLKEATKISRRRSTEKIVRWTLKGHTARACLVNKCFTKETPAE